MGKKPAKPTSKFPLTPRSDNRWCKRIKGRLHYFTGTAEEAMQQYLDLLAGRQPKKPGEITIAGMVNLFLADADQRTKSGELSPLSFRDYRGTGQKMLEHFGRHGNPQEVSPTQFASFRSKIVGAYAPSRAGKTITVCRMMFRWAREMEHIKHEPNYGPNFKANTKRAARLAKVASEAKVLEAKEIRQLMSETDRQFEAMILLGINCGLGNRDIAEMDFAHVDTIAGWLTYARTKTGVQRRCPLWPETVAALNDVIDHRPQPTTDGDATRLFLTTTGRPFMTISNEGRVDKLGTRFAMLLKRCNIKRKGVGFYTLRHMLQTIGDGSCDAVAVGALMGHADNTMAGNYRQRIDDSRLQAVTNHVRRWLFD